MEVAPSGLDASVAANFGEGYLAAVGSALIEVCRKPREELHVVHDAQDDLVTRHGDVLVGLLGDTLCFPLRRSDEFRGQPAAPETEEVEHESARLDSRQQSELLRTKDQDVLPNELQKAERS